MEDRVTELEKQNNQIDQYSRRNNIEISGVPPEVTNNQLEEKVIDILKAIDVEITSKDIEACHRLGKKQKDVIVRVVNRKHCLQALRNKKKLMSVDKKALGIPNARLFLSENLTPVNSKLAFYCRKLHRDGEIEKSYTINGIVTIIKDNDKLKIHHLKDLQELFPEYVFHDDNAD